MKHSIITEIIETPFEVFKTILNTRLNELTNPTRQTRCREE